MNEQRSIKGKAEFKTAPEVENDDQAKVGKKGKADRKAALSNKALPDTFKPKLQEKSAKRRKHQAALVKVEEAASGHGRNDLQPTLRVIERPIDALKPSQARVRVTTPEQLARVINSITSHTLVVPLLIDGDDTIISGHVVWEAARKLGLQSIACIPIEHLDEHEAEALALALNRMGETGSWDIELLRERMIVLEGAGVELSSTGFTLPEIDQIMIADSTEDEVESECEAEDENSEDQVSKVRLDDLFELGRHRLLCGDALIKASYETLLEGHQADCVISDPPYNCEISGFASGLGKHKHENFSQAVGEKSDEEFKAYLATYLGHCQAFTSAGAIIFAFMDWRQIEKLLIAGDKVGLTRKNVAVWNKGGGGAMGSLYRSAHELIAVFCNAKTPKTNNIELGRHGRNRSNVFTYPGANRPGTSAAEALTDHPTPKNLNLIEDMLLDVTERGDLVLDPFVGSGVSIHACETTGRVCAGIEIEPKYVDRAIRRWERLTGEDAIHAQTGLTFSELMRKRINEQGG